MTRWDFLSLAVCHSLPVCHCFLSKRWVCATVSQELVSMMGHCELTRCGLFMRSPAHSLRLNIFPGWLVSKYFCISAFCFLLWQTTVHCGFDLVVFYQIHVEEGVHYKKKKKKYFRESKVIKALKLAYCVQPPPMSTPKYSKHYFMDESQPGPHTPADHLSTHQPDELILLSLTVNLHTE